MLILDDALNFLGHNIFDRTLSVALIGAITYILYRCILEPLLTILNGIVIFLRGRNSSAVYLEVTPPKHNEKSPLATQQLFTVLQQTMKNWTKVM